MSKLPYMQFYPSDFLVHVQNLTLEERGAWITLICFIWLHSKNGTTELGNDEICSLLGNNGIDLTKALLRKRIAEISVEKRDHQPFEIFKITSKRIEKDKHELSKNAEYQAKHRGSLNGFSKGLSKGQSKTTVRPKKSEVRLETTTYALNESNAVDNSASPPKAKDETDIQTIVRGWKILNSIPTEGDESKTWDKVHFPRLAKSAKSLLTLFGELDTAVCAMEYVYQHLKSKRLDCTLETIVKRSDLYRNVKTYGFPV